MLSLVPQPTLWLDGSRRGVTVARTGSSRKGMGLIWHASLGRLMKRHATSAGREAAAAPQMPPPQRPLAPPLQAPRGTVE